MITDQAAERAHAVTLNRRQLEDAARALLGCLQTGGKVLVFGNGGSAAHAQHMAAEFVGRLRHVRAPLPAVALTADAAVITAIANDFGFEQIFARQITALGNRGDIAVALSTSGESPNIIAGARAAQAAGMRVLAITGADGQLAREADLVVRAPRADAQLIQEAHAVAVHVLCEAVETHFTHGRSPEGSTRAAAKVLSTSELQAMRLGWRAAGYPVVWTSGRFDLLHVGHVRYLEMAKGLGGILIVGVLDSAMTVGRGSDHAVVSPRDRAELVAGLASVDFVTILGAAEPHDLLRLLQPDVYCGAGDGTASAPSEGGNVETYGDRVELLPPFSELSGRDVVAPAARIASPDRHSQPTTAAATE
jgi:cytidyltransferase-like protein